MPSLSHGMHASCSRQSFLAMRKHAATLMRRNTSANRLRTPLPASKLLLVYKEIEATHFEGHSGLYNKSTGQNTNSRSRPTCVPVAPGDPLPPLREMELRVGLQAMRRLGARILETFDDDQQHGALLHVARAPVPSLTTPVDCLHWLLPGVPDTWTEKLLRLVAREGM